MTTEAAETTIETTKSDDGWEWCVVEIFGHRRHAGRACEEERFGTKMLRIDVPKEGDAAANGWTTHYYTGGSIFSYSLTDEATAIRMNKPWVRPSPVSLPPPDADQDDDGDDDQDHE